MNESQLHLWELYRGRMAHEDLWVQQRVSWLLGFSGLLFAAFAGVLNISTQVTIAQTLFRGYVLLLIPATGFLITFLVLLSLIGAGMAMDEVRREWDERLRAEEASSSLPPIHARGWPLMLGRLASQGICGVMLVVWAVVFLLVPQVA